MEQRNQIELQKNEKNLELDYNQQNLQSLKQEHQN